MRRAIAVDFDGTLCENAWPKIGAPNKELISQLIEEQKNGAAIILWTCRARRLLDEAVRWSEKHGLTFDYVNQNVPERLRIYGSISRKISADVYIDDKAAAFSFGARLNLGGKENAGKDGQGISEI